jgi:tRNA A-37 threonylcarbamoyl transferase component Bud32
MASVWVARLQGKHGFEKTVAIKTILPQYAGDARFRNMFLDEARILSQIQHVNVAQILDMGEERGLLYLVMEFVDGDPVSKLLRQVSVRGLEVPAGVLLRVCADTCAGLHAAHELRDKPTGRPLGLVHRDVSPQNVLVTEDGAAKLIDFGIAKSAGRIAQDTNAGGVKGKILFMAPEQAAGRALDRRADVWSIGAMLYAAYARRTPFEGASELETLHALGRGDDPAPLADSVPRPLRDVVARATRFSPDARYATALALGRALEETMAKMGLAASPTDVAMFMATHMREGAEGRRRTIEFALKAAAQRDRVREAQGDAMSGLHAEQRMPMADALDASHDTAPAGQRTLGLGLFPSSPPPMPPLASAAPHEADHGVPELDLPIRPPKAKKPPLPQPAFASSPFDDDDDGAPVVVPPPRIASAAGSILGSDVLPSKPPPPYRSAPPAPPLDHEPHSQEFLDPLAIAARRAGAAVASSAPPRRQVQLADHGPPPGAHDLLSPGRPMRAIGADVGAEVRGERARARPETRRSSRLRLAVVTAAVLLLSALGLGALAPSVARRVLIGAMQEQGLALTIERITIGLTTVHAHGLVVRAPELGGREATASEATIHLRFIGAESVVVQDPVVTFEGSSDDAADALEKLRARALAAAPKASRLTLQNGKVTWTGALGAGSRVDADAIGVDVSRAAAELGDQTRITIPNVRIVTARGTLGPWRVDADRTPKTERLRLGFDPVLADGPSAMFVRSENGTTATMRIVRQPLARLGLPHAFLGLVPDEQTQLEATVQVMRPLPGRIAGDVAVTIFDARLRPEAARLDVVLKGQFAGAPGQPLDVTRAQLSFGPLTAQVLGAVTPLDDSFRVDLKWSVLPLPCGVLLKQQSPLQAKASGIVGFDSRRPDLASFAVTEAKTCGMALFP